MVLTIYIVILVQYPFGVGIFQLLLHKDIHTAFEPSYLLVWGTVRIGLVLPMIFYLLQQLSWDTNDIFLRLGNFRKVIAVTFWLTFGFVLLGIIFYPWFLRQGTLTPLVFIEYMPMFLIYAISNAFVEETFFRGIFQNILAMKMSVLLAVIAQAAFFAVIHFYSPMSSNLLLFVFLTFFLGILWGWLTVRFRSLIPAIVLHVAADIFVAISLF